MCGPGEVARGIDETFARSHHGVGHVFEGVCTGGREKGRAVGGRGEGEVATRAWGLRPGCACEFTAGPGLIGQFTVT